MYNLIQIDWNKSKKDSGELNCAKYARIISDILRRIAFHVNTLIYSFKFYLLLRIYYLATLRILIPSDPRKRNRYPGPETPSLAQVEAVFFPVFCQINSHVAISGATFVVPPQASMQPFASPRQVVTSNSPDLPDTDAQTRQILKTHHTHQDTPFWLTSHNDQEKSQQFWYTIL